MKIWLKFLVGGAVGLLLGFVIPPRESQQAVEFIARLVVSLGRYALMPMLFFSVAIAVYELREDKQLLPALARTGAAGLATTVGMALVGIVSVLIATPGKIEGTPKGQVQDSALGIGPFLTQVFPDNLFSVFLSPNGFLLPLLFLGVLVGVLFSQDRAISKPLLPVFDSLSRIFYHISSLFIELLGIGIIALGAWTMTRFRSAENLASYGQLFSILAIDSVLVVFGLLPLALYFFGGRKNPYKWLYASLAPAIAGFFSGDANLALSVALKHGKESFGVRRRINTLSMPLLGVLARGGTAMVTAVSFVFILNTYSRMGVSLDQMFWILGASVLASFLLGPFPGSGAVVAVSALCQTFGRGYEQGFIYLQPVAFVLLAFSAMLDVLVASLCNYWVAKGAGMQAEKETRFFI